MKRLIVVYNPNSSRFSKVRAEVLDYLKNLSGYMIGKYEVKNTDVDDNAANLARIIKDGDLVISAGGDATASIAANGVMKSNKDATLAVLPYGNFNDLARTLGVKRVDTIFSKKAKHQKLYPLEIFVDGKFFRYATCYVTIGMTAEAVELFDNPKTRQKLQKGHKSSWRSYFYLAFWYFKNRHKKQFIPDVKLNGRQQHHKTSDYAAVNGRSMSRVMKGGDDYHVPIVFKSTTDRLTNFWRLFILMARSILVRIPGYPTKGDTLEFLKPATVELQAEGEYRVFKDIKKIEIRKAKKCLKVIEI